MNRVPLCEHGIIIGSISPCNECEMNKIKCKKCNSVFSKEGLEIKSTWYPRNTDYIDCPNCYNRLFIHPNENNKLYLIDTEELDLDKIEMILKESTIIDKIEFSGISAQLIRNKLNDLKFRQVPNRNVLLDMKDEEVIEYWFKNWLHPQLKHAVKKSPSDKRGCSKK